MQQPPPSRQLFWQIAILSTLVAGALAFLLASWKHGYRISLLNWELLGETSAETSTPAEGATPSGDSSSVAPTAPLLLANGRPQLYPLPTIKEVWQCEVIVVGGSLGGVAAASHAMKSGAKTCLIELTPWLGGQISSQGVSAIDESFTMVRANNFSPSWKAFKQLIKQQPVPLPNWFKQTRKFSVPEINHCWVGTLCFPPKLGHQAALQQLKSSSGFAPGSRWGTSIAFKGAEFDARGRFITAVYAVRRIPRYPNYIPEGRPSKELSTWYSWSPNTVFAKVPLRLEAPPGKRLIVIDATDTGELVAWGRIPYRVGSESPMTSGEPNAALKDNPYCTQAFTFPFVLAIANDFGYSRTALARVAPEYSKHEHRREYSLMGFPMFNGVRSFFKYRRILSTTPNGRFYGGPAPGDMTVVNWSRGNNWNWMNPPLILTDEKLTETGQYQNWMGGLSASALRQAEDHALLFSEWLMTTQSDPRYPLAHLLGAESPMGTISGLSMMPYIREGRRIIGRSSYGQLDFMVREQDIRNDMPGAREFKSSAVAVTHYDIDIQGCRERNWKPSGEAVSASVKEDYVRPTVIPIESLIPQGVENLLIGGKPIAVTHIANGVTRIHYSEWSIGGAAGATAGWLLKQAPPDLMPAEIVPMKFMPRLQQYLRRQGLRFSWY